MTFLNDKSPARGFLLGVRQATDFESTGSGLSDVLAEGLTRGGSDGLLVVLGYHLIAPFHVGAKRPNGSASGVHQLLAGLSFFGGGGAGHAQIL